MLKKIILSLIAVSTSILAQVSDAEFKIVEKELVQSVLKGTKVAKVERGDVEGMYEAYMDNGRILYVYPMARKIFFGDIYTATGINLTEKKRRAWGEVLQNKYIEKSNVKLADIQKFSLAVDYNGGNDKYKVVMITDPECYYCRKAEDFLQESKVSLEYVFHIAVNSHQYAPTLIDNILSSKEPSKLMKEIANEDVSKVLSNRNTSYDDGLKKLSEIGVVDTKLNVTDTVRKRKKDMDDYVLKSGGRGTPLFMIFDKHTGSLIDFIKGADIEKLRKYTN